MLALATSLRNALLGSSPITSLLSAYQGSYPIFTRRPVPSDAPFPIIVVSPDIAISNTDDGIRDQRPLLTRDISIYGINDTPQHYRDVETLSDAVRTLFHRKRTAFSVSGWNVVLVLANGPVPAPVDDYTMVGRVVPLAIQLAKLGI